MKNEIEFKEQFGKSLSEARKNNNVTQQQLADKINYSDKSVSKWERGESLPDLYTAYTICEKLGTTPNHLFGIENENDTFKKQESEGIDIKEKKKKVISAFVPLITAFGILFICCIIYFILKSIPDNCLHELCC